MHHPTSPFHTGRFIVSLDCEGKWGMADHITAHHDRHLTQANLARAYERLVRLFARYDVPATFAFVLAFTLTPKEQEALVDRFADVEVEGANWLRHFRAAQARGDTDGWFCPDALEIVRDAPIHEIACHSFSHLPLAEGAVTRADAQREMESMQLAAGLKRIVPTTFVYPRNQVGHVAELAAAGFTGYRARPPAWGRGKLAKVGNILAEFDVTTPAQPAQLERDHGMTVIPSGYFLNWQRGPRRAVPRWVSRRRWRHVLADAAAHGRVAHIWLHPHNLIDGPGTAERLEDVLADAARLRDAGRLKMVTQAQYCADMP